MNYHDEVNLKKFYQEYFDILSVESYKEFEDEDSLLLLGRKK